VLLYSIVSMFVVVLSLAALGVAFFGEEANLRALIHGEIETFPADERVHALVWLFVYVMAALLFAEISGSTQLLLRVRTFVATLFFYGDRWTHSTIWYWAIDEKTRNVHPDRTVGARVILKDGSLYTGVVANYPVVADDSKKDFVLQQVHRFNADSREFEPFGKEMSLLLNNRDCWSIQVGPGPEKEPTSRSRWEQGMQAALWITLLAGASVTLMSLDQRSTHDLLLRILIAFVWATASWSFLGLFRYVLREQSPSRWEDVRVQRLWLFAGAVSMLTIVLTLSAGLGWISVVGFGVGLALITVALVIEPAP